MNPTYHSAPAMTCNAPARAFPRPEDALRHARTAADAFRVGYTVYEVLAGRPRKLAAFSPNPVAGGGTRP